jgi:hypothetical protein
VVLIPVHAVSWLRTILCPLGYMAGTAEKLALASLGNQVFPCSCPVGTKLEALSSRIDVIELKTLCRTATDTASAKQL